MNALKKSIICLLGYTALYMAKLIYSMKLTGSWDGLINLFGVPGYTSVSIFIIVCDSAKILLLANAVALGIKGLMMYNKPKTTIISNTSESGTIHAIFNPHHYNAFGENIHDITFLFDTKGNNNETLTLLNIDIDHENEEIHITTFGNENGETKEIETIIDIAPQTVEPKKSEDDMK
jgi:hypothetical protein